ncbi:hypothetical protein ST47_g10041 [Ascochyta rabiei]|uniref:Uncharacterized protein n=2 Tax=Didymella rabiei TaxID=5454 RepID=A0A162W6D8_DIDRA|nr:hypothetical protein ST47_g10041 [Ascochyta rabiei]
MPSTTLSSAPRSQQSTTMESHKPHIPYRDTGAAGKCIYGQPPSWTFKPLPPFPFERVQTLETEPFDDDCHSMTTQTGEDDARLEQKRESKVIKAVKNLSRKLTAAVSKT